MREGSKGDMSGGRAIQMLTMLGKKAVNMSGRHLPLTFKGEPSRGFRRKVGCSAELGSIANIMV